MKPISPYKNIEQYTRIMLEPYQINSDLINQLKINLKKKVEKKCNKNGFVDEVFKILFHGDGIMQPENLSGNVLYNIKYHCRLCLPIENSIIIGQVKLINLELIVVVNGPIITFIQPNKSDNIDSSLWDVLNNFKYKKETTDENKKLKIGDYVLIQILNKRINSGDTQIKTIGKLLDFASDDQIKKYFETSKEEMNSVDTNEQDQSNFII
jgi:DNA-directed RNA polymerase subunit E'/Rpb7